MDDRNEIDGRLSRMEQAKARPPIDTTTLGPIRITAAPVWTDSYQRWHSAIAKAGDPARIITPKMAFEAGYKSASGANMGGLARDQIADRDAAFRREMDRMNRRG